MVGAQFRWPERSVWDAEVAGSSPAAPTMFIKGFVYILHSLKDNKKYIGSTINVKNRLIKHNNGEVRSTKFRRPLELKYILEYDSIKLASFMEKKFKKSHDILVRELKKRKLL